MLYNTPLKKKTRKELGKRIRKRGGEKEGPARADSSPSWTQRTRPSCARIKGEGGAPLPSPSRRCRALAARLCHAIRVFPCASCTLSPAAERYPAAAAAYCATHRWGCCCPALPATKELAEKKEKKRRRREFRASHSDRLRRPFFRGNDLRTLLRY